MNFCCNYFVKQKSFQNFYGQLMEKRPFYLNLCLRWKFTAIKLGSRSLSTALWFTFWPLCFSQLLFLAFSRKKNPSKNALSLSLIIGNPAPHSFNYTRLLNFTRLYYIFSFFFKVIYSKYSKHLPYLLASTKSCGCSKIYSKLDSKI